MGGGFHWIWAHQRQGGVWENFERLRWVLEVNWSFSGLIFKIPSLGFYLDEPPPPGIFVV